MEEGGSSVPGDTGLPAGTATPDSSFEVVVAEDAGTDCEGCCERMASTAVGDGGVTGSQQTVEPELFSHAGQQGSSADPLKLSDSIPKDNVGTLPADNSTHGAFEPVCEEQRPASGTDHAEVVGSADVGSREDDICDFPTFSPLPTVLHAELPDSPGTGAEIFRESYSNDDNSRSNKEFTSTAGGLGIIDSSAASTHASLLEVEVHCMDEPDQIKECGRNTLPPEPAKDLPGNSDSIDSCHSGHGSEDIAEYAHGTVAGATLVGNVDGQPEGPVHGCDDMEANQFNGGSDDPSEPTVKPIGIMDANTHSSSDAIEEFIEPEKQDGVLSMHFGENVSQNDSCSLHNEEDDDFVKISDNKKSQNDSSCETELGNASQGSHLLAQSGVNALQVTSSASSVPEKGVHLAPEEESHNHSGNKVEMCNSCQESPGAKPSCSHLEDSSSYHLHPGPDALDSCQFTENAICGSMGSSYHDKHEDEGTYIPKLHQFRGQSGFQAEESSVADLQPPSMRTDCCLFPQVVAPFAGTDSDDGAKGTPTPCSSVAECQPECCDLPENGANNPTVTDPVSVPRRKNPVRAAHFKPVSTSAKSPNQSSTATKSSGPKKAKKKKTPVSRSLGSVSFGNTTKKRSSRIGVRSCGWGTIETVYRMFENSNFLDLLSELARTDSTSMMLRKGNGRKRSNSKKARKGSAVERVSDKNLLIQNDQRNSQVVLSRFVDLQDCENLEDSGTGQIRKCPENEQASTTYGCSQVEFSPCHMNLDNQAASSAGDAHIGDKDLESSVTLETSNENYPSDYHVVSSQMGSGSLAEFVGDRRQTYADTSPESEIIHPASDIDPTTNDTAMYINQKTCGVNGARSQNDSFSNFHMQYNFDSANYAAPSTLTPPLSLCSQPTNPIQEKDNGEVQGYSLQSVHEPLLEKTGRGFDFEMNARYEQDSQTGARSSKCYKRKTKRKNQKEAQGQGVQVDCQSLKVVESRCPEETLEAELEMLKQYRALSAVRNEKNTVDICTEAKKSKSKPKLKDFARSKQHDPFGRKKIKSNILKKNKKNKEKSLCLLAPGDGHHEVASRPEHIHDYLSTPSASVLGETAESKRSMTMHDLHNSEGAPNALCLLDSAKISCESTTLINAEHGLQNFGPLEDRQCWVRCDDCFKWRFIPTAIADTLGEDCKWTCKDNIDKNFADCAVPQAKTDAEINEELGISDEEEYNTAKPQFRLSSTIKAKPQAPWTLIRSNLFLHRGRKKQNIDEVMVCQCRPPEDGSLGCRDACLNRMLNIECVRGTCPCGDLCSNQQFQRRKYAKLKWFRCGKKGYGLQVLQNVPHGKFLIEYVGEVLDVSTYEARQREYASGGQRHFYFMTLNGSEVIDACYKGNLGRFINHSCNPNCRTEKWMVNGEVCIGLFAIRDIKKGEELTFDYNYVRVFGAAAKKCFCGAFDCRGYIGADPLNAENIVQGDSDEEFPEPVMLKDGDVSHQKKKDGKVRSLPEVKRQDAINIESTKCEEHDRDVDGRCPEFVPLPSLFGGDECLQASETVDNLQLKPPPEGTHGFHSDEKSQTATVAAPAVPLEGLNAASDTICVSLSLKQEVDVPLQVADASSGSALDTNKPVVGEDTRHLTATVKDEELAKCIVSVKPSTPSVLAKNNRSGTNRNLGRKGKRMVIGGHSCHFEGVDGRLNELLDASGGISKHKDAARGYLKLLVLTANSRDNAESEANQSTRDLSLILDALLKTKSGKVLMDIINKNGVQMLHNILKQSHRSKNKVPILRKLLKVFEYFALKKVLTVEHINMNPSCEGAESFRDSIISLTQHADAQVHKIARNFRDTWMRRPVRKFDQLERDNGWLGLQNRSSCQSILSSKSNSGQLVKDDDKILLTSPSIIGGSPAKSDAPPKHDTLSNETLDGRKRRRRRTRWDRDEPAFVDSTDPQPSEAYRNHSVAVASINTRSESCSDPEILNSRYCSIRDKKHSDSKGSNQDNLSTQDVDEIPPGFDLMLHDSKNTVSSVDMSGPANDVATGIVQERYLPDLAISHGIPIQLMQQLGTPANEGREGFSRWAVAPGMPYHPFPPLPPYPRKKSRNNNPPVLEPTQVSPSMQSVSSSSSELALPSTSGRTSGHSRSYSLKSQAIKRGPSSMDNAMGDSFRHQRCRDHKSNGFKTAWSSERSRHQVTGTKRCRTQDTLDGDVLEKGGGGGFGSSPSRR